MNDRVARAWAKSIFALMITVASLVIAKGYPLAYGFAAIWLLFSLAGVVEAWAEWRPRK